MINKKLQLIHKLYKVWWICSPWTCRHLILTEAITLERITISILKTWMCISRQGRLSFIRTPRTNSFGRISLCLCQHRKVWHLVTCSCKVLMQQRQLPSRATPRQQLSSLRSASPSSFQGQQVPNLRSQDQVPQRHPQLFLGRRLREAPLEVSWVQQHRQPSWIQQA